MKLQTCPECDANFKDGATLPAHSFCGRPCPGSGQTVYSVGDRVLFNGGFPGTVVQIYSAGMIVVRGERGSACIPNGDAQKVA